MDALSLSAQSISRRRAHGVGLTACPLDALLFRAKARRFAQDTRATTYAGLGANPGRCGHIKKRGGRGGAAAPIVQPLTVLVIGALACHAWRRLVAGHRHRNLDRRDRASADHRNRCVRARGSPRRCADPFHRGRAGVFIFCWERFLLDARAGSVRAPSAKKEAPAVVRRIVEQPDLVKSRRAINL